MTMTEAPPSPERPWSFPRKFAFRWIVLYFVLFALDGIAQLVPVFGGGLGYLVEQTLRPIVAWFGQTAFGVTITVYPNGSGDTTYNWIEIAFFASLATVGAMLWSLVDRRRTSYPWVRDGFLVAMRFVVAGAMLGYGINKIFALQFPTPGMGRLLQNYGDSSPMGILWTFMGTSTAYTMFAGWMETIGGLLLLFRRTALLGALWTAGVMANVVLLNLCYDVPVKIYSSHLLLMALLVAAPDMGRLLGHFLLNRPMAQRDLIGPWTNRTLRWTAFGVKLCWVLVSVPLIAWGHYQMQYTFGPKAPKGPLDGTWEVLEFRRDGVDRPPLVTDELRWRYLTLTDRPAWKQAAAAPMRGTTERWVLEVRSDGPTGGSLLLTSQAAAAGAPATAPPQAGTLEYALLGDGTMSVTGTVNGAAIEALCKRREPSEFLLLNRGFHWINEVPFNR